jgi:hypothetical protein
MLIIMKKHTLFLVALLFSLLSVDSDACTTFIISGKHTRDGRPVLYKQRDTGTLNNAIAYFSDGKYDYIGLVDSNKDWGIQVWGGYNSAGFAIMNSAAYNNNIGDTSKMIDQEGDIMKLALQRCATLADFEKMLTDMPKPLGVDANFGVIDASGGAAYYETGQYGFKKIDANDPAIAPFGVIIRTNYSFTGSSDVGSGYIRYETAREALNLAVASGRFQPQYLINIISRNLNHSLTRDNLKERIPANGLTPEFRFFEDFIPRNSTASVIMVVGARMGEDAAATMMWAVVGFPLTTVAVPLWISAGKNLPVIVSMKQNLHSPLCDAGMLLKDRCFPITRGSGRKYINVSALFNAEKNGIMQLLEPVENEIFSKTAALVESMPAGKPQAEKIQAHYKWLDSYITTSYKTLFSIDLK